MVRIGVSKAYRAIVLVLLSGGLAHEGWARTDARPSRAESQRAHQTWRLDDVRLGAAAPVTALLGGRPVVFVAERRSGSVVAIDIGTGKTRWTAIRPKAASVDTDRAVIGPQRRVAKQPSPADGTDIQLEGNVLSVKWRPTFESKLAIADGRVISSRAIEMRATGMRGPPKAPDGKWRIAGAWIEEIDEG